MKRLLQFIPKRAASSTRGERPLIHTKALHALALLLMLVQLPHVLHLPLWVSALGLLLTALRLVQWHQHRPSVLAFLLSSISVSAIAIASAFLIKLEYGYFIGRDPCVAFLFILLSAKFAEVKRSADATFLVCLAAFLLLTQYFYSQTILSALLTLPAVIAMTYALAVLRDADSPVSNKEQLRLVVRLLLQGVPLAAVLFVLFPRLPGPLWSLPEDAMATTGLSDSMSPGSIGELSRSDAVAFRVEFDDRVPQPHERYWRGPVLTEFDGQRWSVSPQRIRATSDYQGNGAERVNYTVMLQPHRQRWLFALDAAVSQPTSFSQLSQGTEATAEISQPATPPRVLGSLFIDGQILAPKPVSQVLRYRQSSVLTDAVYPHFYPMENTLALPQRNTRTQALARELHQQATNNAAYAQSVLAFFHQENFYYTLSPQLLGDRPVDEFLFDSRRGFCEHYASAFVVLMRAAGIPARVVTGYQGGEMNGSYMIVRQSDAHAWAEAFINGVWQRYDPTGAVAPSRIEQGLAAALPSEVLVPRLARQSSGWLKSTQLRWDALNHEWQRLIVDFNNDSQQRFWQKLGLSTPALWQVTVVILLVGGLSYVLVSGLPLRPRLKQSHEDRHWQRLCRLLRSRQLKQMPGESSAEYLQRAANALPRHAERLHHLQELFEQLRFMPVTTEQQTLLKSQIQHELWRLRLALLAPVVPALSSSGK